MTMVSGILFLLFFLCSFVSCTSLEEESLEKVLFLSGNNRGEWEKVLGHFSSEEDSLKKKAAIFLLKNMHSHYTWEGEFIDLLNYRLQENDYQNNYAWYKTINTSVKIYRSIVMEKMTIISI